MLTKADRQRLKNLYVASFGDRQSLEQMLSQGFNLDENELYNARETAFSSYSANEQLPPGIWIQLPPDTEPSPYSPQIRKYVRRVEGILQEITIMSEEKYGNGELPWLEVRERPAGFYKIGAREFLYGSYPMYEAKDIIETRIWTNHDALARLKER